MKFLKLLLAASITVVPLAPSVAKPAAVASSPVAIADRQVTIGNQRFRYLEGGSGGTLIVLLHGWPQNADEWRKVMPPLAARNRVVAIDLPGVGGTSSPSRDFSKAAMARDLHTFVQSLGAKHVVLVGHDVGGMIAYAYARQFAHDLKGAVILDVPLPGLAPWEMVKSIPQAWHFRFNAQQPLAEQLVTGRQATYFRYFIDQKATNRAAIGEDDVAGYAAAYGSTDQLAAGFGFYRAFAQDELFNDQQRDPLTLPLLIAGADGSVGEGVGAMAQALRERGASAVQVATISNSGHWVAEEQPAQTVRLIEGFVREVTE